MLRRNLILATLILLAALSPLRGSTAQTPSPPIDVSQFVELQRIGRGAISNVALSPDNQTLAVETSLGVWFYDLADPQNAELYADRRQAAWSPDGKYLASLDPENQVRIWEAASQKEVLTFPYDREISSFAWSPDSRQMATLNKEFTVAIWDITSGENVLTLPHMLNVYRIAWSTDGNRLRTTGRNVINEWDTDSGDLVNTFDFPDGSSIIMGISPHTSQLALHDGRTYQVSVWDVASHEFLFNLAKDVQPILWSPDESRIVTIGAGKVSVWDTHTGRGMFNLLPLDFPRSAEWSPDGTRLALAGYQGEEKVIIWDAANGQELRSTPTINLAQTLQWSADGRFLTGLFGRGRVTIWDANNLQEVFSISHMSPLKAILWSPDGKRLATMNDYSPSVYLWEAASGQELLRLDHGGDVTSLDWSPDSTRLASSDFDPTIHIWDAATGESLFDVGQANYVNDVAWSPDGSYFAIASSLGLKIWSASTYHLLHTVTTHANRLAWSPDGSQLASFCDWCFVTIYNSAGQELHTFDFWNNFYADIEGEITVTTVVWSPDGTQFAISVAGTEYYDTETEVSVWDATNFQRHLSIRFFEDTEEHHSYAVSWSPDGAHLAIWDQQYNFDFPDNMFLAIFNAQSGDQQHTLLYTPFLHSTAWSPDGRNFAVADGRGIHIWEAASGVEIFSLSSYTGILAWSPDGTRLAIGGGDGIVRIWGMPDQ